jgi:hypothetical protein
MLNTENTSQNDFHKTITNQVHDLKHNLENDIAPTITIQEIKNAIKSLKNGKSTSMDLISNEMLKNGGNMLLKPLQKLFNFILNSGQFPATWNESILVLMHKTGNKLDPCNYRGISITSNLGKLFNRIIHSRLLDFIEEASLISENQIGFKKKSRTSDHLFTIKSISEHYKNKKQKVYASFIDLRKAFDTIWRVGLFYKLLISKIPPVCSILSILCMKIQKPRSSLKMVSVKPSHQNVVLNKALY